MAAVNDRSEADALFAAYHDRIHRYLTGLVGDPAEAEDLTQETFLRAYCRRTTLRDPGAVRGWLYRIATHACLDHLRRRRPQTSLEDAESPASPAPAVQESIERAETSSCVHRCLDFLSDSYRAVILLHEAHGLTAPEIAELLGVSLATVKIRLHRARLKLQEIMQIGCALSHRASGEPCCEPTGDGRRFIERAGAKPPG